MFYKELLDNNMLLQHHNSYFLSDENKSFLRIIGAWCTYLTPSTLLDNNLFNLIIW